MRTQQLLCHKIPKYTFVKPMTTKIIHAITGQSVSYAELHLADILISMILIRARILVQVTIYRRLLIGRDGHLDQPEAYDIS